MTVPQLVVHGHFYQPPRLDPFSETMPIDPTAAPARDWNQRISADCYRPNALAGNLGAMSWDVGPTLAQGNDYIGVAVRTTLDAPTDAWWAPIETVSNSESGFERVYQGGGLLLSWPLRLAAGERWSRTIRQAVTTAHDRRADGA